MPPTNADRLSPPPDDDKVWQDLPDTPEPGVAMTTMNISLPDQLKTFVETQVAERGYQSASEYIRDLLRREQDRLHVRELVLEGMRSPLCEEPIDEAWFERMRARHKRPDDT
jgi:antitoxin ParD1/3/4